VPIQVCPSKLAAYTIPYLPYSCCLPSSSSIYLYCSTLQIQPYLANNIQLPKALYTSFLLLLYNIPFTILSTK